MVGVALHQSLIDEAPELLAALRTGLAPAKDWVLANRTEAAQLAERTMQLRPAGVRDARSTTSTSTWCRRRPSEPEIETFYRAILDLSPATLGGTLPPDEFYLDL